ncbi:semaphorin-5A-like isoform X1 [Acanthaster planci]|uniref:Semaphorin-5A-like isoform X1 n=1 Tax=Acanthaster planci TaxID=133434 RepID=A0A8B7XMU5_ACAPL|nr:semaphorin-5A-like isoform X1 [Acanthaster planci]
MVSLAMSSLFSLTMCVLLVSVTSNPVTSQPDRNFFCFSHRTPIGKRGKCRDKIAPAQNLTQWDPATCCRAGGSGWSHRANGKRCEAACAENEPPRPTPQETEHGPVPMESFEMILDVGQASNGSTNYDNVTWSEWGTWSNCSAQCGIGNKTRTRTCLRELARNSTSEDEAVPCVKELACNYTSEAEAVPCVKELACNDTSEEETVPCDTNVTCIAVFSPVHGRWTGWSEWSECNQTDPCMPNSFQMSNRSCTAPSPANGGRFCRGPSTRTRPCSRRNCGPPRGSSGQWSSWGEWSLCSATKCGDAGYKYRERQCVGVATCVGSFVDLELCQAPC